MNKKYLLLTTFLVAIFATLNVTTVKSKITSPPAGSSGDPVNTGTCAQSGCHNGSAQTPASGDLTLTIGTGNPTTPLDASFVYTPGTAYNIGFLINSFTGRYGFQMAALNGSNTQAGTFAVTNAATTKINTATGRNYIGHLNASSTKSWVYKWTAPASGTGTVTFYYSYNTANDDNNPTGDVIYKGSVSIEALLSGVEDISTKVADLNIFPNPISSQFSISFDLKEADNVSAQLYSLDGKLMKELINEKMNSGNVNQQFDVNDLAAGIYLVKLNVGGATITKKIVKQ